MWSTVDPTSSDSDDWYGNDYYDDTEGDVEDVHKDSDIDEDEKLDDDDYDDDEDMLTLSTG